MDTCLNIIVVEDNDELREATVDALCAEGHLVLGLDCAEALPEQASWRRVDLMVVDLNLPGEDGLALTRRVRSLDRFGFFLDSPPSTPLAATASLLSRTCSSMRGQR